MKINEQITRPDPILIYNYFLLEERITKCDEEVGIKTLFRLKESQERNLFIFLLRLKQNKFFNKYFFQHRQFSPGFFNNETLSTLTEVAYEYMQQNADRIGYEKQVKFMSVVDKHGKLMSKYVNETFIACLFTSQNSVIFVIWRNCDDCHYKCTKINVIFF